jgi:hypothetical protein
MASRHKDVNVLTYHRQVKRGVTNNSSGAHLARRHKVWWEITVNGKKMKLNSPNAVFGGAK